MEIPVPAYYNGKLRLMAVGGLGGLRRGRRSGPGTAVAPLVLTPQLPLTVSPGDSFEGALVLANTTDQPVRVEVAATADTGLAFSAAPPSQAEVGAAGRGGAAVPSAGHGSGRSGGCAFHGPLRGTRHTSGRPHCP